MNLIRFCVFALAHFTLIGIILLAMSALPGLWGLGLLLWFFLVTLALIGVTHGEIK